ncbi:MAG: U32 family peptidase C-terminal domain-containing protein [Oscillospiraceae bacterium]|nr:U32 family peptidase C-terminal domain-containing protein [Oscillospiraceae bacterium]
MSRPELLAPAGDLECCKTALRFGADAVYLAGRPVPAWVLQEPLKVSHREYCTGFFFKAPAKAPQITLAGGYTRAWEVVGIVERWENGVCHAVQRGRAFAGDALEALAPGQPPLPLSLTDLRDGDGCKIDATRHPEMLFSFTCASPLPKGAVLRGPSSQ